MIHDGVEQWPQVLAERVGFEARGALLGIGIDDGKIQLRFRRVEIDEEVEDFVQDFRRSRIRAIDLVDDDNRRQPSRERFAEDESRLR